MAAKPILDKVLIANRGEIACRVISTCKRMGIKTVAIHSNVDEQAKHVKMADEAVCVGTAMSKDSYLRSDRIIEACLDKKVTAVHPGYGFLSENSQFSADLAKNNILFVGPDAHAIESMGDKINSKRIAKEAGCTIIPGFAGEITSDEQLLKMSNEIGYPVMVKASAGGGGKGMHIAYNDKECVEYFHLCKAEALSSFGNDTMLVEKFIEAPRHIEIQIIADRHGNTLYLPERECSIQRRNQKVLEEAPSSFIDAKTRKAMGEEAAAMARKVDYVTAGTVEMVVDPKRNFYFLEMNTRLQVEHPITELITGVDLVEQMLRATANLPLSIKQEDIKINGWATESRVYAEDPTKNYFPSIGRLTAYEEPTGPGVRVDSGILNGSQISVYYDPLIAKLCTWGKDRGESIERMRNALDSYVVRGLTHNVCLLHDVLCHEDYIKGNIKTSFLVDTYGDEGFKQTALNPAQKTLLLSVASVLRLAAEANASQVSSRKVSKADYKVSLAGANADAVATTVTANGGTSYTIASGAETLELTVDWKIGFPVVTVHNGGKKTVLQYFGKNEVTYQVQMFGTVFSVDVHTPPEHEGAKHMIEIDNTASAKELLSPMPGVVIAIHVAVGDKVVAGTTICTLEAMKMRNLLKCEVDGVVKAVHCVEGKNVEDAAVLVEFE
jgi:propionyl-CoA carboxylase alpha chain